MGAGKKQAKKSPFGQSPKQQLSLVRVKLPPGIFQIQRVPPPKTLFCHQLLFRGMSDLYLRRLLRGPGVCNLAGHTQKAHPGRLALPISPRPASSAASLLCNIPAPFRTPLPTVG